MGRIARHAALAAGVVTAGVLLWARPLQQHRVVHTAPVVVAQKDMPEGSSIDRAAVAVAQWPVGTVPAGAFASIDEVAGRITRVSVFKGEALVPGRLAPNGRDPGLEVKISPGKRALSFRIADVSGITGLVQPNSRVDIVLIENEGVNKRKVARLFMENVRVLAIGTVVQRAEDGRPINAGVCTVEVTPEEGERLAIATARGTIQLMLRGYGQSDAPDVTGLNTRQFVSTLVRGTAPTPSPVAPRAATPKPDTNTVTIIRGPNARQQRARSP